MKRRAIRLHLLLLLFASAGIISCRHPAGHERAYITGNTGSREEVVLRCIDTLRTYGTDSVKSRRNGDFSFKLKITEPGFYFIEAGKVRSGILVIQPGDSIKIYAGGTDRESISGGIEAERYARFTEKRQQALREIDSVSAFLEQARYRDDFATLRDSAALKYNQIAALLKLHATEYIINNPAALSQILVINTKIGQSSLFDEFADSRWFLLTDSALREHYPGNRHLILHQRRVDKLKQRLALEEASRKALQAGNAAPPIRLPDMSGNPRALGDTPGEYTLVYFWAPNDAASRKSNHELKQFYERYRNRGLSVYAVSLDPLAERWKAAVNLDKLWWINVNDTLGVNSPVAAEYMVTKLPVILLLDSKKKIIDRFVSVSMAGEYMESVFKGKNKH
jgi:thiol-disulfide isomerase/thioredoxin